MTGQHIYTQSILESEARNHQRQAEDNTTKRDKALLQGNIAQAIEYHRQARDHQQKECEYMALGDRLAYLTRKDQT